MHKALVVIGMDTALSLQDLLVEDTFRGDHVVKLNLVNLDDKNETNKCSHLNTSMKSI